MGLSMQHTSGSHRYRSAKSSGFYQKSRAAAMWLPPVHTAPLGHSRHTPCTSRLYVPSGHGTHSSFEMRYSPTWHSTSEGTIGLLSHNTWRPTACLAASRTSGGIEPTPKDARGTAVTLGSSIHYRNAAVMRPSSHDKEGYPSIWTRAAAAAASAFPPAASAAECVCMVAVAD